MNRLFFLRAPLSRALGLLAATLMLNACERVWDNPADPEAPSYQGYPSVKTADEIEAVTPDGTEMIYQSFLVNEVLEAQAYRLEIATDKQFSKVIYRDDTLTSNFLGAKASLNRGPTYYWRGAAKKHDAWGKWTEGRGFKLVSSITPMKPASGISTTDTTPEFSWTAVDGAVKYQIQIADSEGDMDFNPTVDDKNVSGTSYTPTTALTNLLTHHWRVRAVDGNDQAGAWSGSSSLRVEWGTVSGLDPTDGSSTTDTTPEFGWTAVIGATRYEIQIADSEGDMDFNPTVDDKNVSGTRYTPTALANKQRHYWRVRAVDGDGQFGAWSGSQTLNINFDTVSGLNPTDGSSTTDTTPTFSWTAVTGADKYQIQVADNAANLAGSSTVNVPGTSYTPTMALTNLLTHHWRVRAVDGDGQFGAWSGASSLRVEWGTVSGLDPTDGSSTTDTTPEFRWTAVAGATRYEIQIADSESALEGSPAVAVSDTSYTSTTALTNLLTYHWRVRAVDGEGQFGAWSGASSLRVEWGAVSGLSPTDGSSTTDITPEFRWTAVAGAAKYEIQIADSEANLAGSQSVDVNDGTSYTPTTALTNLLTYHWRVRAVDSEGQFGAWSGASSLRVEWGAVSGLSPTDGSSTTDITPEFRWTAVAGAAKYEIQIADSEANLAGSQSVDVNDGTSYTPTTALTNLLTYHWRVRAVDGEGQFGAWSGPFSFSIFAPINYEFRLAFVGQPYSLSLANALPSVTYSVSPALPDGLNLDTSTGRIYGTPTTRQFVKDYSITVTPTSGGRSATATVSLFVKETAKNKDDLWRMIDEEIEAQGNTADLNLIDTSKITDMSHLFNSDTSLSDSHADYSAFNGDISGWDVSSVTDMSRMFSIARRFNGDISGWDVSNVKDMSFMFYWADAFNGDISKWDVSSVTNMSTMFSCASAFNGDISNWDVSSVTNMINMFSADAFNGDISKWDVSNVKDMSYMFCCADAFNGDISNWDVSGVTDMSRMFQKAYAFNGDISKWDVSNVKHMSGMFYWADAFNGDISKWDVSNVKNMSYMFFKAEAFNGDISKWDVSSVTNMSTMFYAATAFNGNISEWDVSSVTDMSRMFDDADAFNGDISKWNVSNVKDMSDMFRWADAFNGDIAGWDVSGVKDMSEMFREADAFNGDIASWNVSNVTDMSRMFEGAYAFNGDISSWNVSGVKNMYRMFYNADAFNRDISSWNVSGVKNMYRMFSGADAFNGDIASWNVSNVTDMSWMFEGADAFNGDIASWNVSNVTDMRSMFSWANAFNGDISGWDVSGVTDMRWMFNEAHAFNRNLEPWGVHLSGREVSMYKMFEGSGLENTPSWYK